MANFVTLSQPYFNGNANAVVATTPISVLGIFINSGNAAITLSDGIGGNVLISAWTPTTTGWQWMPFRTNTGLTINIAGSMNYTISLAG